MAAYVLKASRYTTAADLQKAVSTLYHVGFDNGTVFYGYNLVPDITQSGGWHEKTDIAAKDAQIQYASPNIIDRDFVFWPRVTQGDWSGGGRQITFINPNQYFDSDLEVRTPGYMTLRRRLQRDQVATGATAFVGGRAFQQIVEFGGHFWLAFAEASTFYRETTPFTTHGAKQPVFLDTDGHYLLIGDGVNTVDSYDFNGAWVETNINALAGGLGSFDLMWVFNQGTFGHFLYYAGSGTQNVLFKVDLSLGKPIAAVNHVQVPLDNLTETLIDIVPYQNGLAILTMGYLFDSWSVWLHDGVNLTQIVHVNGYMATGICNCLGSLYVSTCDNYGKLPPSLYEIASGSVRRVADSAPPKSATIQGWALQPRAGDHYVYWPYTNADPQFTAQQFTVGIYDVVTGALARLPLVDINDLQIAGRPTPGTISVNESYRRLALVGDAVGTTLSTGTGPSSYTLDVQYQIGGTLQPVITPPFQASGRMITSRIDFQTPGVEKRFRRCEAQHAPLPTNTSVKIDAFVDKDPAAYTAALAPDATVTNIVAGTVSTDLFLANLIGHTVYFAITLASSDGLNTPVLNYYFVEAGTPWSWEMLLDCTAVRRLLNGETDDPQGATGKDLAYFFRNAWETPSKLTMYHRNGQTYTVAIESLDFWNPSPMTQSAPQSRRDEEYQVKVILRQTL
jgi:hypothetical protein